MVSVRVFRTGWHMLLRPLDDDFLYILSEQSVVLTASSLSRSCTHYPLASRSRLIAI